MRTRIQYILPAQIARFDRTTISSSSVFRAVNGFACHQDSALNYTELPFVEEAGLRGGYPRIVLSPGGKLLLSLEFDATRNLTRKELAALKLEMDGQMLDGIGAGCFDELTAATGLSIQIAASAKSKCQQAAGTAWRPGRTTENGNRSRIDAVRKQMEKLESLPPDVNTAKQSPAGETLPSASPKARSASPKARSSRAKAKSPQAKLSTSTTGPGRLAPSEPESSRARPDFQKLFQLLAKPERDQLIPQIKNELDRVGNDLSSVVDGQLPNMNFQNPKLLRLLLDAGLPPNTTDVSRHSLLIQAAVNPKSIQILLKHGVDVNRVCESTHTVTALMRAASVGALLSVELLLQNGAAPGLKNRNGKTALDMVDRRSKSRQKIIDLLNSHS
ncbi:MAG: ankyrin repeat domain-containing protein [Planctomycetaceae bacterium]|nr:ankyrin repeat domain-containing protein [Planctomycetaceae bacterium]